MTVTSGLKWHASLQSSDPATCWVRMCLASFAWASTKRYLTWKPLVTPQGRLVFQLWPWVPTTSATESGYMVLPTPRVGGEERAETVIACKGRKAAAKHNLTAALGLLPTPVSSRLEGKSSEDYSPTLEEALKLIPSPTEQEGDNSTLPPSQLDRSSMVGWLMRQRLLPTHTTTRPKDNDNTAGQHIPSQNQMDLAKAILPPGGRLNPNFVEYLMGYPQDWTKADDNDSSN